MADALTSAALFSPGETMRRASLYWRHARDGDEHARALFHRHYSYRPYRAGRAPKLFVGPGEKMVLLSECGRALFVWRRFISGDEQQGISCSIFRNESAILSSLLILDAETAAAERWGKQRLFTYINGRKVKSGNPGYCFRCAGWERVGVTKHRSLIILAKQA